MRLRIPSLQESESLCLAEFAAWFEWSSVRPVFEDEVNDDQMSHWEDKDVFEPTLGADSGARSTRTYRKRVKAKIIHFVGYKEARDPDLFYNERDLLFLPWKFDGDDLMALSLAEDELLLAGYDTFEARYMAEKDLIDHNSAPYDYNSSIDWEEVERYAEQTAEADAELADSSLPNVCHPPAPPDATPAEFIVPPDFRTSSVSSSIEKLPSAQRLLPDEEFRSQMRLLTLTQRAFVYHVLHVLKHPGSRPPVLFLTGGAGTGKSLLFRCLTQLVARSFSGAIGPHSKSLKVLLSAYTGSVAFNIEGTTIHSAFRIPMFAKLEKYLPLGGEKKAELRDNYVDLRLNIIDEVSTAGARLLQMVNYRMQEIFDNTDIFGGVPTILGGDLF